MTTPNIVTNFVPELDAVVMSGFVFAGQAYEQGKPFPHKQLKADKPSLNGLWLAGLIRFIAAPTIPAGKIDELVNAIESNRSNGDTKFDDALRELVTIARGSVVEAPPAPIVYKEDPADEPDAETLAKLKADVKATVPKPLKAKTKPDGDTTPSERS